ncbi:NAD-dependent epimerase/dehydratase family protein [Alphaproteobacteria bacterium]|nr:NAD-dependent epimerase/dehydratase family protein [Alphaproteobacteria bacterium]
MNYYKNKRVLVTGGSGLIGQPLVKLLQEAGASVRVVSLDDPSRAPLNVEFIQADLRQLSNCERVCEGIEIVFHLAGVKGSPRMTMEKPASFLVPTVTFSFNMMEAARRQGVKQFLFTSSVGVYSPAEIFFEDDVWKTFPSPNDRFAGWAKRVCELQAEAYKIEYDWDSISIVRPANVYGPFDNFDPENAMVIPSLIHRAVSGESPLVVWGDGSPIRDFIFSTDVAIGMMTVVEKGISHPVNLGSGVGVSIKQIVETLIDIMGDGREIVWDTTKPAGDAKRLMDTTRASNVGFRPLIGIKEGMETTLNWYLKHKESLVNQRYNAFTETN